MNLICKLLGHKDKGPKFKRILVGIVRPTELLKNYDSRHWLEEEPASDSARFLERVRVWRKICARCGG